jgi:hypothetical protein
LCSCLHQDAGQPSDKTGRGRPGPGSYPRQLQVLQKCKRRHERPPLQMTLEKALPLSSSTAVAAAASLHGRLTYALADSPPWKRWVSQHKAAQGAALPPHAGSCQHVQGCAAPAPPSPLFTSTRQGSLHGWLQAAYPWLAYE